MILLTVITISGIRFRAFLLHFHFFVSQEELVAKLQKEKKFWAEGRQQKEEDLQAAEDRANHLNRVKAKLEQNLDELEDSVEREKKVMFETWKKYPKDSKSLLGHLIDQPNS